MNILDEIKKHDLGTFKQIDTGDDGVSMALKYFDSSENQKMAERLRQIIENGNVRLGPLEGCVAAAVCLPQGEFILLSSLDQKNSTAFEIMASLVREVGSFKDFNCSKKDNEMRSMIAVFWAKRHLSQPSVPKTQVEPKAEPKVEPKLEPKVEPKVVPKEVSNSKIKKKDIDPEVVKLLKADLLRRHNVYPIKIDNEKLVLAMSNPRDLRAMEEIEWIVNMPITPVLVSRGEIDNLLDGVGDNDEAINNLIESVAEVAEIQEFKPVKEDSAKDTMNAKEQEFQILMQSESPTVKLIDLILTDAIKASASDVHLEPREHGIDVRYRLDGDLKNILQIPIKFHGKIVARVKILSNLDITQNVAPQDGRIQLMLEGRKIDFRVSTIPTFYGEKVAIRILDSQAAKVDLNILGFNSHEKEMS